MNSRNLPLWLTPMQAVAWIVTRDPTVVQQAGLEARWEEPPPEQNWPVSDTGEWQPDDPGGVTQDTSQPGISLLRLSIVHAMRDTAAPRSAPPDMAREELVDRLRAGKLIATAEQLTKDECERKDMPAAEWVKASFAELPRTEKHLTLMRQHGNLPAKPDTRWAEVLLPRDAVLAIWPAELREATRTSQHPVERAQTVPELSASPAARIRRSGLDYREQDAPLLREMKRMVDAEEASGLKNAARAVVHHAVGTKNDESKIKRLLIGYQRLYGQSGQF